MFALYLEETKAMVRTNHPELYEAEQILLDHEVIKDMDEDTFNELKKKSDMFPTLPMPHFWKGLYHARHQRWVCTKITHRRVSRTTCLKWNLC